MKISEIFFSLQGEGLYTGVPSVFIRFFLCSLQCQGFGQRNPADPSSYEQPWKKIDVVNIDDISQLPPEVYEYGCDSVYSWSAKFKGMQHDYTVDSLIDKMKELGQYDNIISGKTHLIITGGEPLMKSTQPFIAEFIDRLTAVSDSIMITFETNGTQMLQDGLKKSLTKAKEVIFSVSPKLLHVSGELPSKAIKRDAVASYSDSGDIIFKYVYANTQEAKQDLFDAIKAFDGLSDIIYLMPEGPNKHRVSASRAEVAEFCMQHGFRFTDRLHTHLWDNKIGT